MRESLEDLVDKKNFIYKLTTLRAVNLKLKTSDVWRACLDLLRELPRVDLQPEEIALYEMALFKSAGVRLAGELAHVLHDLQYPTIEDPDAYFDVFGLKAFRQEFSVYGSVGISIGVEHGAPDIIPFLQIGKESKSTTARFEYPVRNWQSLVTCHKLLLLIGE